MKKVEILPYHTMGKAKWQKLGIPYQLEGVPMPSAEEVKRGEELLGIHKAPDRALPQDEGPIRCC